MNLELLKDQLEVILKFRKKGAPFTRSEAAIYIMFTCLQSEYGTTITGEHKLAEIFKWSRTSVCDLKRELIKQGLIRYHSEKGLSSTIEWVTEEETEEQFSFGITTKSIKDIENPTNEVVLSNNGVERREIATNVFVSNGSEKIPTTKYNDLKIALLNELKQNSEKVECLRLASVNSKEYGNLKDLYHNLETIIKQESKNSEGYDVKVTTKKITDLAVNIFENLPDYIKNGQFDFKYIVFNISTIYVDVKNKNKQTESLNLNKQAFWKFCGEENDKKMDVLKKFANNQWLKSDYKTIINDFLNGFDFSKGNTVAYDKLREHLKNTATDRALLKK